jgi:hypothetical protein
MSANQFCGNCGQLDYAFMPVCVDCGALLDAAISPEMHRYYDQLPAHIKHKIHALTEIEHRFYSDGVPEFNKRWRELQNIAFQLAFGFSHDTWHTQEIMRLQAAMMSSMLSSEGHR